MHNLTASICTVSVAALSLACWSCQNVIIRFAPIDIELWQTVVHRHSLAWAAIRGHALQALMQQSLLVPGHKMCHTVLQL